MSTGIVHIGVGNFFRAHQARYIDELIADDPNSPWAICGVGMLPSDRPVRDALRQQDWSYALVIKHPDGMLERQVVSSLREMLLAPEDPWAVVERLAHPATRIVTMTITEGGYNVDDVTGQFLPTTPAVVADARPHAQPSTVFAVVAHALRRRREEGLPPFTIVSCDNIEGNGHVARTAFVGFAEMIDPALAAWIRDSVSFPSSMVDRITPVTTPEDWALVRDRWGEPSGAPVTCEPFTQWVLEEGFPHGRPQLEQVGVQMVPDVRPYELMKLRLLNASHQALAYFGQLLGHELVHDAATDPDLVALVRRYMDDEATPTLPEVPGIDLRTYKDTLLERFANPAIADTLARLAAYPSDRIPKWLLPVVRTNLDSGGQLQLSAAVVASWLRWTELRPQDVVDRRWDMRAPELLLRDEELFGDLIACEPFQAAVRGSLELLRSETARVALRRLLGL